MKRSCLLSLILFVALILVSCASVPNEASAKTYENYDYLKSYYSKYPSSEFSSDNGKLYFNSYGPDLFFHDNNYGKLKFGIAHLLEDGFVYVSLRSDSVSILDKAKNLLNASSSFYVPFVGSPNSARVDDFAVVVDKIYKNKTESKNSPVIGGVSSSDFSYKEKNEFNTVLPEKKLEELRSIKDSQIESFVNRNGKDMPRNYTGKCPYDFTLLCHWYSREFELEGPEYTSLVYHCVSTVETFTTTTIAAVNETLTTFISDFWIEGFEVYNVKTGTWEWYDTDEYHIFMETNGYSMPLDFKEFIEEAPYCVAKWFYFSTDYVFNSSSRTYTNKHDMPYSLIKHCLSPALEDLYDFKEGIVDMIVPSWDSLFF